MNDDVDQRHPWTDRLSDYIDDDLPEPERQEVERHLNACVECRTTVEDLRRVVMMAAALDREVAPHQDLWPDISARLTPRRARTASRRALRAAWLRPQVAAALLVIGCLAALWLVPMRSVPGPRRTAVRPVTPWGWNEAEHEYEKTVAGLQREAEARLTLDPHLVEVLNENVATLDAAIARYREALATEPGDEQLRKRLTAARQTKLEMLQHAVALAAEGTE